MKGFSAIFLLFFTLLCLNTFGQVSTVKRVINGKEYIVHTVEKGQTIYALSKLYGVTDKEIYAANPGSEISISIGKELFIPTNKSVSPQTPKTVITEKIHYTIHTVSRQETLYGLSKQYGVTVDAIVSANPDVVNGLKTGTQIRIPQESEEVTVIENEKDDSKDDENEPEVVTPTVVVPDIGYRFSSKEDCIKGASLKKEYSVGLLLPLGNNPKAEYRQSRVAFQFYAGAILAQKYFLPQRISIKWKVFNTGESDDSATVAKLISSGSLDALDMIVGPLYARGLSQVSNFAAHKKIPVLSPTVRTGNVLEGNPYLLKSTPSPELYITGVAEYIAANFDHVILVEPQGKEDSLYMKAVHTELKNITENSGKTISYIEVGKTPVMDLVKPGVKNLIYYPTKKELSVTNFLTGLRKVKTSDKITVMGDESWLRFKNFDADYYSNVGLRVPLVSFSTPEVSALAPFVKRFREEFKTDPEVYAFRGYDAVCYVTEMLETYGASLPECIHFQNPMYLFSPFKMVKKQGGGFDNKGISVLVIEEYQLRLESN